MNTLPALLFVSAAFFYLGLATLRPSAGVGGIGDVIATAYARSLALAWAGALVAYVLHLNGPAIFGLLVVTMIVLALANGPAWRRSDPRPESRLRWDLAALAVLGFSLLAVAYFDDVAQRYDVVFAMFDAVNAYNHWAIQLSRHTYESSGAAYPLLFPGLWSLIYKIQGDTDFWLITKATLLIPPLLFAVYCVALTMSTRRAFPVVFGWLVFESVVLRSSLFLSGYMDTPLVIMGAFALLSSWHENENDRPTNNAMLFGGLSAITKQAGVFFLGFAVLARLVYTKDLRVFVARHWRSILIAACLPASFLVFYFAHEDLGNIRHALGSLQRQSSRATATAMDQWELFTSLLSVPKLAVLSLLALAALDRGHKRRTVVVIISLAIFALGCALWTRLSAYDTRNLNWAVMFLLYPAAIGADRLLEFVLRKTGLARRAERAWPAAVRRGTATILLALPLVVVVSVATVPSARLVEINHEERNRILYAEVDNLFQAHVPDLTTIRLLTNLYPLEWVFDLQGRVTRYWWGQPPAHFYATLAQQDITHILVAKWPHTNLRLLSTIEADPRIRLLGTEGGFALYEVRD